jgi:tellurite resistance-related uncharacterized protein
MGLMETLSNSIARLRTAGFSHDLRAAPDAMLLCDCEVGVKPPELQVMVTQRFEGSSNPDDEDIVIAAITPCGHAAIFSSAFGPAAGLDESGALALIGPQKHLVDLRVPDGLALMSTSREFTATSTPAGLLKAHHLAEEIWGRLRVATGTVEFCFEHDSERPATIAAGEHCDIPPSVMHHATPSTEASFCIEFYRALRAC